MLFCIIQIHIKGKILTVKNMVELMFAIQIRIISLYCKAYGQQYSRNVCQGNGGKKMWGLQKIWQAKKLL